MVGFVTFYELLKRTFQSSKAIESEIPAGNKLKHFKVKNLELFHFFA